jgi:3'-phosphoadenosine 5'-phosphosulfate sulfotransferase (PAPS reductase)/FAD synthetase
MKELHISWFSAGVSSAVATKLAIAEIDQIIYTHIDDQHPDTLRFVTDCEAWFGKPVQILQSQYRNVEAAVRAGGSAFVNGPSGANCTRWLKKRVRKDWENERVGTHLTYYWGLDVDEKERAERITDAMPGQHHRFPLIEAGMSKEDAHQVLRASGVKRPVMYELGYHNNNCVGCVKGGMGYWNKIRVDFPAVFAARAAMERRVGGTCINGVFLDELDPKRGRHEGPICDDCGIMCELSAL